MGVSKDLDMKTIDVDSQQCVQNVDKNHHTTRTNSDAAEILKQWKMEYWLKRSMLLLRGITFFFSFISFILVTRNKLGDSRTFNTFKEYGYLLAIAIITCLYTGYQVFRQVIELYIHKNLFQPPVLIDFDFIGDQVVTYFLISAVSSAIPITSKLREVSSDNILLDYAAIAISFSFYAFLCLALSAIISGYKLSTQVWI